MTEATRLNADDNIAMVTGEASYEGSATGVRALSGSVDYFEGDATLTAKFGDNEALGSLTGEIATSSQAAWTWATISFWI